MNNQIQMRIDNVNLKPECTHFMAQSGMRDVINAA